MARVTTMLLLATMIGAVANTEPVLAQTNCDMYGRLAVKQAQENDQKKCNFKGPEWSGDLKAHVAWCGSVAPDQWKVQLQKREQALTSCAKKS